MRKIILSLIWITFFVQSSGATPSTLYEIEPNNTPIEATSFSGEMVLTGSIKKGDQDAFMWKIGEEESLYSWNIELVGIPNAMTRIDIMKVIFTSDGKEVENYQKFFSFGTKTGNKPVHLRNLLFEKGEYLIALSSKSKEDIYQEQSYQIVLTRSRKVYSNIKEDSKDEAPNFTVQEYNDNDYHHYTFEKSSGWFKFEIDKKGSKKLWTLRGISTIGHEAKVKLVDETGTQMAQSKSNKFGKFKIADLELDMGKYYLHYEGETEGLNHGLKVYSTANQKVDEHEVKPNNKKSEANAINYKKIIHGKIDEKGESDYFSFSLPKKLEDKVFDITLTIDDKDAYFYLSNAEGKRIYRKRIDANFTMRNLSLESDKTYQIEIYSRKKGALYNFKFSEFREPNPNHEAEPNDNIKDAYTINLEENITGNFQGDEYDCFSFNIEKPNMLWSMTATGVKLERLELFKGRSTRRLLSISKNKNSELTFKNLLLLPGNYRTCLHGESGTYSFAVKEIELADLNIGSLEDIEHEPNQNKSQTNELKFGQTIKGVLEHKNNEDYFHFTLKNHEHIRLSATPPKEGDVRIKLISDLLTKKAYPEIGDPSIIEGVYPPGRYIINLWSKKPSYGLYDLKLERLNFFESNASKLDLSLKIINTNDTIATYSESGQKVKLSVDIESLEDIELNIESHVSDTTWKLDVNKSIHIKSKERKIVPFALVIPKNIGKTPVVTTLKFSNENGDFKTVSFEIQPKENAKLLNPYDDWGIPDSMLGGFNVARLDFGAKRVPAYEEIEFGYVPKVMVQTHLLFDNQTYKGQGFHLYSGRKTLDENVTIELAGDEESEIIGVILNPVGEGLKKHQLKDFSISLSKDGNNYQHVYRGVLGLRSQDQSFAFDKPYRAKYARLTLHNSYENRRDGNIALGEWKVIAKQESVTGLEAFNIASPKLGGHIVRSSKELSAGWDRYILTQKDDVRSSRYLYKKDKELSWVVGFKNERIAKINDMMWREPKDSKKETYMKNVKILVSTQTPTGPWKELADWNKGNANQSAYVFEQPTWARYVKFVFPIEKNAYYALPETLQIFETKAVSSPLPWYLTRPEALQVFETKVNNNYSSILGEWGSKSHRSFYEYQQSKVDKPMEVIRGNETKEQAFTLEENQTIKGRVSVANHEEDWYKVVIPKGHNLFQPTLFGKESVDVTYELFEDNGIRVEPSKVLKLPLKHAYWFDVQEGTYYLKVKQPPISVVFAWDNSDSVSPYHAKIFSAVNNYTQSIQANIEAVNLLCFNKDDRFLLTDFSDKPTQIQTVFNNFDRDCHDSDAERPLRKSAEVLKRREGTKGVIIIGDAVGSRDMKLWDVLDDVKPKVFSIRVQSQNHQNEIYEGVMQSWSRVNNGTYNVVSNGVELYQAINRASAILRRPVYYTLHSKSNYVRPLEDGSLTVVLDPNKKVEVNKNFAIELILDASGSMLKRIKGKRRIAIARDVLKKAVTDIIPPKTQVALRVFGHKKADSCRTDLEMKLQPLNVKKTMRIISKINAKNLAKTPIADSLGKVADDLEKVNGKKVVILVTDGEETCDGDPAKEIQTLKDKGVDVRINIVGFAIDDEALKAQFKSWAELGNGGYFEADDKESLHEAVKKALQVPYKVYNKKDELVASGVVRDEAIKLKGGTYRVVVETSPEQIFEEVVVVGEQMKQIILKDEK